METSNETEQSGNAALLYSGARGKSTLWLVDDDVAFRQMWIDMLQKSDELECKQQFGSAEAVIEVLRHNPGPELMLLDVRMPGINGAAAVKTIKALSPCTAVFMFSTFFSPTKAAEAKANGASGYLRKCERFEVILRALRTANDLVAVERTVG